MESAPTAEHSARSMLVPLALAQFIASYAATNMNVAVTSIAKDLGTDVHGVQTAITLFTLTMAALMVPGSKLTDILGRKPCFRIGLTVYGVGAVIAALAPGLGVLVFGYSALEGIGSALMIPPIYILVTVLTHDVATRARAFGVVSGAAGIGSAAGPLIGGLVTTGISWRASFILQAAVVLVIVIMARRIADPRPEQRPQFDVLGAVLSAAGLFFIVLGILQSGTYGWFTSKEDFAVGSLVIIPKGGISPVWVFVAIGALILAWFFVHIRRRERAGRQPLLATHLFRNRTANLGLVTQNIQWLIMQGAFFVISVFLQTVRGYNAIETGLILTPATAGILISSALAGRMAARRTQRLLIRVGFVLTVGGMLLLLLIGSGTNSSLLSLVPGLLLIGLGVGIMLTASVNVVQSAFPEQEQGEISGLSRSVSNLGSSLGTAIVGSVLVASTARGSGGYAAALLACVIIGLIGLGAALLLPPTPRPAAATAEPAST